MKRIRSASNQKSLNELMIRLVYTEKLNGLRSFKLKQQLLMTYMLIIVKAGNGKLLIDSKEYKVKEGTFYFCSPGQTFGMFAENEELEFYLFRFNVFQEDKQNGVIHRFEDADLFIEHGAIHSQHADHDISIQCEKIVSFWLSNEFLHTYRCQMVFQELLYCISKLEADKEESTFESMERTKEYIDGHYNEKLHIEELARMANLSPNYFVDLFKKVYGKSVIEYLTEVRMDSAKLLLAKGGLKLKQISKQVGYEDEFYFSRKFKQEVGIAPTIYGKKRSRKIAVYDRHLLGQLLALRIIPYAAPIHSKWTEYYFQKYSKDIPIHLNAYRHNLNWKSNIELLAKANPDIVLALDNLSEEENQELEARFPSLIKVPSALHWKEQFAWIADKLDAATDAVKWLQSYEKKVEHVRNRLEENHEQVQSFRIAVLRIFKQSIYLHTNKGIESVLSESLQFAQLIKPSSDGSEDISLEQLKEMQPDCLLLLICQESDTLAFWEQLEQSEAWCELEAVKMNSAHYLPSDPWREYSAYAGSRMVDQVKQLFL